MYSSGEAENTSGSVPEIELKVIPIFQALSEDKR